MSRFSKPLHHINPWKIKEGKLVYDNPWIAVHHDNVVTPGGSNGIYGTVHFKNLAIGIVPIDEEGYTWLVGQYRYALKRWSWEIPEGGCPIGTNPLTTAKRELKEEAGLKAQLWTKIAEFDLSNCVSDESGIIFIAEGITIGASEPDESEELELIRIPFKESYDMALNGQIRDAVSIIGLMKVAQLRPELVK